MTKLHFKKLWLILAVVWLWLGLWASEHVDLWVGVSHLAFGVGWIALMLWLSKSPGKED